MVAEWSTEILDRFDEAAEQYEFPMLNNIYYYYGASRLTAFRSADEWLTVFEVVRYFQKSFLFGNKVYAYGNRVTKDGLQNSVGDPEEFGGSLLRPYGKEVDEAALDQRHLWHFGVLVKGEVRMFSPTPEDYAAAGVNVDSGMPVPAQILRYLVHVLGDEAFHSSDQLLRICGRHDAGLTPLLRLAEWSHPDVADEELPGDTVSMHALAEALAYNDPARFAPDEEPNTHWSNWTQFEKIE